MIALPRPISFIAWLFPSLLIGVQPHPSPARFADPDAEIARVVELMDRRLDLMPEIAAWKWRRHQPVIDAERERQVLDHSVAGAEAINLDGDAARRFFDLQIRMARAAETHAIADWEAQRAQPPEARDLSAELRPALDVIGRDLLAAMYLASSALVDAGASRLRERLSPLHLHPGVDEALLTELSHALAALHLTSPPRLEVIHRVGFLRIGTTGDYPPFSSDRGGELRGADIQLADALAKQWGARAVFVRTTWPTLMEDLKRRRFDIALSGITVTPERAQAAGFSTTYCVDGKAAIARRRDASRYGSLAQIDQPGVRVIVNPGGTNERFVREHITRATIIVHADNRTVFDEIIAGRADVMITDGLEVRLQTRRHPELSGVTGPLNRTEKAILLPAGSDLTKPVNDWLTPRLASGELERALSDAD